MSLPKIKNSIFSGVGHPAYRRLIKEKAKIYMKDGIVVKNRGNMQFDLDEEVRNHNNIVVEDKFGYIDIFCTKELDQKYKDVIEQIRHIYRNDKLIDHICIHVR